jgi:hypothetical protein
MLTSMTRDRPQIASPAHFARGRHSAGQRARAHRFSVQLRRKDEPDEMIVGTIRGVVTMSVLSHTFAMVHTTGCSARAATAIRIAAMDPPPSAPCGIPSCARRGASATTPDRARSILLLVDRMHDVDHEEHHEVIRR